MDLPNDHVRVIRTPTFLLMLSATRCIASWQHWLVIKPPGDLSLPLCCFTWIIWQFYFANSIESVYAFRCQWETFVLWQRWLFCVVGFLLLPVVFVVAVGLLQFSSGPRPSLLLQLGILTPAILWAFPVVLSVTLTIFRRNGDISVAVWQTQERAGSHIVHLFLYLMFLRSSELDNLVGEGIYSMCAMFGMSLVGFTVQLMWHMCLHAYVFMPAVEPPEQVNLLQEPQEHVQNELAIYSAFHGGSEVVELEEQSTMSSERVLPSLPAIARHHVSLGELVTSPSCELPRLSHSDELVIHIDRPVPLRHTPEAFCRF